MFLNKLHDKRTVAELNEAIERQIDSIPEEGITKPHGGWVSKQEEQVRLQNLKAELSYFIQEYA